MPVLVDALTEAVMREHTAEADADTDDTDEQDDHGNDEPELCRGQGVYWYTRVLTELTEVAITAHTGGSVALNLTDGAVTLINCIKDGAGRRDSDLLGVSGRLEVDTAVVGVGVGVDGEVLSARLDVVVELPGVHAQLSHIGLHVDVEHHLDAHAAVLLTGNVEVVHE